MILKVVTLFLVFMAVLAMFGRLRLRLPGKSSRREIPRPRVCPECGRYNLRGGDCPRCTGRRG